MESFKKMVPQVRSMTLDNVFVLLQLYDKTWIIDSLQFFLYICHVPYCLQPFHCCVPLFNLSGSSPSCLFHLCLFVERVFSLFGKGESWDNSRFSPVMWSKLTIITVQWIKSRNWDTIDDWYINNIAKNQVFAVFHSHVICKSVSPKFRELCVETPCLYPSEGHKYGNHKVTNICHWVLL